MNPASWGLSREARQDWGFALGLFVIWLGIVIAIGVTRSAWMDEFFMVNVTGPDTPWQTHYAESWSREPHPPTYSMVLWLWRQFVDVQGDIFAVRAVGIVITALALILALIYWRRSNLPGFRAFAFVLFTTPVLLYYPQETRSYFLSAIGGLYAALFFLKAALDPPDGKPTWRDGAIGFIGAALLGTHLTSLMFACLLFGIAGLYMIATKRWAWLRLSVLVGVLALGPSIALVALSIFGGVSAVLSGFWITRRDLLNTVLELPRFIGAPLVLVGALTLLRFRKPESRKIENRYEKAALLCALAIAASVLALGVLSLVKPMLVPRYLAGPFAALAPEGAILLSSLLELNAGKFRGYSVPLMSAGIALSFVLGVVSLNHIRLSTDWRQPAIALNGVAECNGATIPYLILNHPPDERNLWRSHYEWYAPGHNYQPAFPAAIAEASAQQCPVRLWIAHQVQRGVDPALKAAVASTCAGGERVGLEFADGYLVVDQSASAMIEAWDGPVVPCDQMVIELPGG